MKGLQKYIKIALVVCVMGGLALAYQNSTNSNPCQGQPLCQQIVRAIQEARQTDQTAGFTPLTNSQLVSHGANRFGFGLSPVGDAINAERGDWISVRRMARRIADAVENPRSSVIPGGSNSVMREIADTYSVVTPNLGYSFNPISTNFVTTQKMIEDLRLRMNEAKKKNNRSTMDAARKDRGFMRQQLTGAGVQYRLLLNAFGTQTGRDSGLDDDQVNLENLLADFWFNHFNVDTHKALMYGGLGPGSYERIIRNNMHGSFSDLLFAVTTHPFMLRYLDNDSNRFDLANLRPSNQNLGRELLELHTLGEGPGRVYNQADVEAAALLLTGINVINRYEGNNFRFGTVFLPANHVPDFITRNNKRQQIAPVVMGHRFCLRGGGRSGGSPANCTHPTQKYTSAEHTKLMQGKVRRFTNFLANHSRTKANVCDKLVKRFIGAGRGAVVRSCINSWGNGGNLKAMYRSIVTHPEVWSRKTYRKMIKNPLELTVSSIRQHGFTGQSLLRESSRGGQMIHPFSRQLVQDLVFVGLPYRKWDTPTGYDEFGRSWLSQGYFVRWTTVNDKLANFFEAHGGSHSLLGLRPRQGINRSWEAHFRDLRNGQQRVQFLSEIFQLGGTQVHNSRIRNRMIANTDPNNTSRQIRQRIDNKLTPVSLKTALIMQTNSLVFLRR